MIQTTAAAGRVGRCAAVPAVSASARSARPPPRPRSDAGVDGELGRQRRARTARSRPAPCARIGRRPRRCRAARRRPGASARAPCATSSGQSSCTSAKRAIDARARSRQARRCAVASMMTGTPASVSVAAMNTERAVDDLALGRRSTSACGVSTRRIASSSRSRDRLARARPARGRRRARQRWTCRCRARPVIQMAQLIGRLRSSRDDVGQVESVPRRQRRRQMDEVGARTGSARSRIPPRVREHQRPEGEERRQHVQELVVAGWSRCTWRGTRGTARGTARPRRARPSRAALRMPKNR